MKNKKIVIISCVAIFIFMILLPIILAATVVAVPGKLISDGITSIGDFLSGDVDSAEKRKLKELFHIYVDSKEAKDQYKIASQTLYKQTSGHKIPVRYILLPMMIIKGSEEDIPKISELSLKYGIKKYKHTEFVVDEKEYIQQLFNDQYFKGKYKINTSTIETLFSKYGKELEYIKSENIAGGNNFSVLYQNYSKDFAYPLRRHAYVTAEFGIYAPFGETLNHYGIDLAYATEDLTCGQPIISSTKGTVIKVDYKPRGAGYYVSVKNGQFVIIYMHLIRPSHLRVGQQIQQGELIGNIGTTGFSTGCHLHFEIRKNGVAENPRYYVDFNNPIIP